MKTIEMIEIFFLRNVEKIGPLISDAQCDGTLLLAHGLFEFGNADQTFARFRACELERVVRDARALQFKDGLRPVHLIASCDEMHFLARCFELFQKVHHLQVRRRSPIVKNNRIVNIKDDILRIGWHRTVGGIFGKLL